MADSTRASNAGLERVDRARQRKGWKKGETAWCQFAATSPATLKRFWRGRAIQTDAFIAICKAVGVNWQEIAAPEDEGSSEPASPETVSFAPAHSAFVGREAAIAHLHTLVQQGAKAIAIQSPGGVGKTLLARTYLRQTFGGNILEFPIAKEVKDIAPVERLVEERLRQLGETPDPELMISLARLKQVLQQRPFGVLVDNLEPALDSQGRLIAAHRSYGELLRVLTDPSLQSVTLMTSREPLHEAVDVVPYCLPSLSSQAWQDFFAARGIETEEEALSDLHRAFGGNALAMKVLCDPIQRYFGGNLTAYWQANNGDGDGDGSNNWTRELAVETLMQEQFNRLQAIRPAAYRLLCRLGCYRYQDVPTVPIEGLLCLLWDVPVEQQRRAIRQLCDRALIEFTAGEYWLHPAIRAAAIGRLRQSDDWELANSAAAQFWTDQIKTVETIEDALVAFEAYHHYAAAADFHRASTVMTRERANQWGKREGLAYSFFRLGLLQPMRNAIPKTIAALDAAALDAAALDAAALDADDTAALEQQGKLYSAWADLSWIVGDIPQSTACNQALGQLAMRLNSKTLKADYLFGMSICQFYRGELEQSWDFLQQFNQIDRDTVGSNYAADSWYLLAFLNSVFGRESEAESLAKKSLTMELSETKFSGASAGYRSIFLGLTYQNLGYLEQSLAFYQAAIAYAETSGCVLVKALALIWLASFYRETGKVERARSHHLEAIKIFEQIGARCDLPEAHYQLGLTEERLGHLDQSQTHFERAIELFQSMGVPKQVEKVKQSLAGLGVRCQVSGFERWQCFSHRSEN